MEAVEDKVESLIEPILEDQAAKEETKNVDEITNDKTTT